MDLRFNRKNTKLLIKSCNNNTTIDKRRLDFILETKGSICGTINISLFKRTMFLIEKQEERYRLITYVKGIPYLYLIQDIDMFLKYIAVDELVTENIKTFQDMMESIKDLPSTGIIVIDDDKIFLYDNIDGDSK